MPFINFYILLVSDCLSCVSSIKGIIFPILNYKSLVDPFKTYQKNIEEGWGKIKKFLKESDDKDSVYRKMIDEHGIEDEKAFQDIMGLLFAGHDTTSHGIASAIYFIKKYPNVHTTLLEELNNLGVNSNSDFASSEVKESIQN
mmetsp:Transcript_21329/g.18934  ORF Transcript_21329/g.18934 Transcript_21329/m.18934 type:complete len:143 (+) Transcript_21329:685-1113(+)